MSTIKNAEAITAVTRQASEGASQSASAASQLSTKAEQLLVLVLYLSKPSLFHLT